MSRTVVCTDTACSHETCFNAGCGEAVAAERLRLQREQDAEQHSKDALEALYVLRAANRCGQCAQKWRWLRARAGVVTWEQRVASSLLSQPLSRSRRMLSGSAMHGARATGAYARRATFSIAIHMRWCMR